MSLPEKRSGERAHLWRDETGELQFVHEKYADGSWGYRHRISGSRCPEHGDRSKPPRLRKEWCYAKPAIAAALMWNMPALAQALARGKTIHWTAGEKDADRLQDELPRGQVATSVHQGEGKGGATPEQFALFRSFQGRIYIYADCDHRITPGNYKGLRDAIDRYDGLLRVGIEPKQIYIRLPRAGKDVFDHFAAGHEFKAFRPANVQKVRDRVSPESQASPSTAKSERLLAKFHDALKAHGCYPGRGEDWNCPHPAHEDKHASFGIAIGETGKLVLNCQACMPGPGTDKHKKWLREILEALGLDWSALGERWMGNGDGSHVRLTRASDIKIRPVRWVWDGRIPRGEITLTPGQGGIGKSLFHSWLIAQTTRGLLPGIFMGEPRACVIATTEDSWEHTVAPRLKVAGADMRMVYRIDVITDEGREVSVSLPQHLGETEELLRERNAALLSVDPLLGFLSAKLDSYKDAEVRQALEPLRMLAYRAEIAVLGNAHFNKGGSHKDVSDRIMASAAFYNLARSVLAFAQDKAEHSFIITQIKNNLGRLDLPSLTYEIESAYVRTEEGMAEVGRLRMLGESERSVSDVLLSELSGESGTGDGNEAETWLVDFLESRENEEAPVAAILEAGARDGFSKDQLKRAKRKAGIAGIKSGFTAGWVWKLTPASRGRVRGEPSNSALPSRSSGPTSDNVTLPSALPSDNGHRTLRRNVSGAPFYEA